LSSFEEGYNLLVELVVINNTCLGTHESGNRVGPARDPDRYDLVGDIGWNTDPCTDVLENQALASRHGRKYDKAPRGPSATSNKLIGVPSWFIYIFDPDGLPRNCYRAGDCCVASNRHRQRVDDPDG